MKDIIFKFKSEENYNEFVEMVKYDADNVEGMNLEENDTSFIITIDSNILENPQ